LDGTIALPVTTDKELAGFNLVGRSKGTVDLKINYIETSKRTQN
jgi:hypothetical protein